VFLGACQAIDGFDRSAIGDWEAALEAGVDRVLLVPLIADAQLRSGNPRAAAALVESVLREHPGHAALVRSRAAAHLAEGRAAEALALLPSDVETLKDSDAHYIVLRALFEGVARRTATAAELSRFTTLSHAYLDRKGPHTAAVQEWLTVVK
jgi:predicted Zn-dependent protease